MPRSMAKSFDKRLKIDLGFHRMTLNISQEITRFTRKEVNARTEALRKASARYRRDIAQLERHADALSKQIACVEQQERRRAAKRVTERNVEGRRVRCRSLPAVRKRAAAREVSGSG